MSKQESIHNFTDIDSFNNLLSDVIENGYSEFEKFAEHFSKTIKIAGPDTFHTTLSVFNSSKEFVGVLTCRDTEDKDDLYLAMAEMLHFPMAISSSIFIVANDVRIRSVDKNTKQLDPNSEPQDALAVTYVTSEYCVVYTCPYLIDSDNNVEFLHSESTISQVATDSDTLSTTGDMIELFFVYSHTNSVGPFSPEEILNYLTSQGYTYKIFHSERLTSKTSSIGFLV